MNTFRVIIAGTRTFSNYPLLADYADKKLSVVCKQNYIEVVSGGASGADALGEMYAKERGYSIKRFDADWYKYGRSAGPRRNKQMAEYADALLAYWDGKSRGTKNMIDLAKANGLKIGVCLYE